MNEEIFELICIDLETTYKGINTLAVSHGSSWGAFRNFMKDNPERLTRYTRARELQLDYLEEQLREVTFEGNKDGEVTNGVNTGSNHIQRDRLKADTLKFILSKLRPQKYGDKLVVEVKKEPRVFEIKKPD